MRQNLEQSLMLVTALSPEIGYEKAAKVAKTAFAEGKTLKEVCVEKGLLDEERAGELLRPEKMV